MVKFNIETLINVHLGISKNPVTSGDGGDIWSSLVAILRDARKVTHRNLDTGEPLKATGDWKDGDFGSWIGAMAYMAVIDQLGSAYGKAKEKNNIRWPRVLTKFGGIKEDEARILYKLRCCFIHEVSLIDSDESVAFEVSGSGQPLVQSPTVHWNGNIEFIGSHHATKVDLKTFGNLVERCVEAHRESFIRGELQANYTPIAFQKKFLFTTRLGATV